MQIIYADMPLPKQLKIGSIFLAGPLPRADMPNQEPAHWHNNACEILEQLGYRGTVYRPDRSDGKVSKSYEDQRIWELNAQRYADVIVYNMVRTRDVLSLTSNTEFGLFVGFGPSRIVVRIPSDEKIAWKTQYQRLLANDYGITSHPSLEATMEQALKIVGKGAYRTGGEVQVPLCVWKTTIFQEWYRTQVAAGQRLDGFELLQTICVGPKRDIVLYWIAKVNWWISKEKRHKTNEVVIARPSVSHVIGIHQKTQTVLLVEEFRSAGNTSDGFIMEPPGGSSFTESDPVAVAIEELSSEAGIDVDKSRLIPISARQVAGTNCPRIAYAFGLELTDNEFNMLQERSGQRFGNPAETEQTLIHMVPISELYSDQGIDWPTLGMVVAAKRVLEI